MFLAGYIGSAEMWIEFAKKWDRELKNDPPIEYLKMSEANRLGGQFRGWSAEARDAKIARLSALIRQHIPYSFQYSLSLIHVDAAFKPHAPRGIGNAHFLLNFAVTSGISQYLIRNRLEDQIEYIFDDQLGVSSDVAISFDIMKDNLPIAAQNAIIGRPLFKSDKDALPLQAADLLAWHVRREHEVGKSPDDPWDAAVRLWGTKNHIVGHVDDAMINRLSNTIQKLPGRDGLKSKAQWQKHRVAFADAIAQGRFPPRRQKLRHLIFRVRTEISLIKLSWEEGRKRRRRPS